MALPIGFFLRAFLVEFFHVIAEVRREGRRRFFIFDFGQFAAIIVRQLFYRTPFQTPPRKS